MPGSSLFALLDDIATLLDDVAAMSKVAVQKTAGVLGDDLALNAQQVTGVNTDRELPVVWAVAKGSLVNKAILVPAALTLSALLPVLVKPLLMIGGLYLCYEGIEKLVHKFLHSRRELDQEHAEHLKAIADPHVDMVAFEKDKIRGAIRTDFVLSAEIIVITLGAVALKNFLTQVGVMIAISIIMTVGVYGLVAAIVKLDDVGLYLNGKSGLGVFRRCQRCLGRFFIEMAPYLLKFLSFAGTAAMFLVGGHILADGIPPLHDFIHHQAHRWTTLPGVGPFFVSLSALVLDLFVGLISGTMALLAVFGLRRLMGKRTPPRH
jgi:predicted DNA repair protein MutK